MYVGVDVDGALGCVEDPTEFNSNGISNIQEVINLVFRGK